MKAALQDIGLGLALIAIGVFLWIDTHAASVDITVPIEPSRLNLTPAEKAAYCGTTAPTCPEVPPAIPPAIPPDAQPSCATNYTKLDWNGTAIERRGYSNAFRPDGVWVVEFRTPSTPSTPNNLPRISAGEYNSPPSTRQAVLSDVPCDFSGTALGMGSSSVSNSVQVVFSVVTSGGFFNPTLKANTTYYFNIKNASGSTCSVSESRECSMFVDLIKPSGL